jgi:hypothetical protein
MKDYYKIVDEYLDTSKFDDIVLDKIYALFKGLMYCNHVPDSFIIKCCKSGRLEELIEQKTKHVYSEYYKWLADSKIKLNDYLITNLVHKKNDFKIYDDNYCPNCNSEGYITDNNVLYMDCPCCLTFCCKKCIIDENKKKYKPFYKLNKLIEGNICVKCYNIIKKIHSHQAYDLKHFGEKGNIDVKFIIDILNEQDNKCYCCNDVLQTMFYKPYCCYQLSIDRIDNLKPHNKNNVKLSCYYCNCKHHEKFNQEQKKCKSGCHDKKIFINTIKAFKFNDFRKPTQIKYDINNPIGKIYKSKIAYMCGIPLIIDWLNDKKVDNQFATYIMADPFTGFAPIEFQSKAGTIIIFREDQIELTENDLDNIWNFFAMLMNYSSYKENAKCICEKRKDGSVICSCNDIVEYDSWQEMIQHPCMNKKAWDNCVRIMREINGMK